MNIAETLTRKGFAPYCHAENRHGGKKHLLMLLVASKHLRFYEVIGARGFRAHFDHVVSVVRKTFHILNFFSRRT